MRPIFEKGKLIPIKCEDYEKFATKTLIKLGIDFDPDYETKLEQLDTEVEEYFLSCGILYLMQPQIYSEEGIKLVFNGDKTVDYYVLYNEDSESLSQVIDIKIQKLISRKTDDALNLIHGFLNTK